jgi:hypothetical protein
MLSTKLLEYIHLKSVVQHPLFSTEIWGFSLLLTNRAYRLKAQGLSSYCRLCIENKQYLKSTQLNLAQPIYHMIMSCGLNCNLDTKYSKLFSKYLIFRLTT